MQIVNHLIGSVICHFETVCFIPFRSVVDITLLLGHEGILTWILMQMVFNRLVVWLMLAQIYANVFHPVFHTFLFGFVSSPGLVRNLSRVHISISCGELMGVIELQVGVL